MTESEQNYEFNIPRRAAAELKLTPEYAKFRVPERSVISGFEAVVNGTKKQKEAAEKALIKQATQGSVNDLLDVSNAALLSLISPHFDGNGEIASLRRLLPDISSTTSIRSVRAFTFELFKVLTSEAGIYIADLSKSSFKGKLELADVLFQIAKGVVAEAKDEVFKDSNKVRFPEAYFGLAVSVHAATEAKGSNLKEFVLTLPPQVTIREAERLTILRDTDVKELTESEFELILKSYRSLDRQIQDQAAEKLNQLFGLPEEELLATLNLFNHCLYSTDKQVHNSALFAISDNSIDEPVAENKQQWFDLVKEHLKRGMEGDVKDTETLAGINALALNIARSGFISALSSHLLYKNTGEKTSSVDDSFYQALKNQKFSTLALDLLIRHLREYGGGHIAEPAFTEFFDERQPLGYFLENLKVHWQDLQKITREKIWPSFIYERGAKLWPGESEIPALEFTGRHYASVLGIKYLRINTIGYDRPEVGIEFRFRDTDSFLFSMLDKEGHLTKLPFDLEETHPHVHALMERLAVCSLQELVTVSSKKFVLKGTGETHPADPNREYQPTVVSLPRHETSYVSLIPRTITIDNLIEGARQRERLPVPIPQKVVPLAYAARYRYFRQQLVEERNKAEEADPHQIRVYEGEMARNFALIPRPSDEKKINLPPEFALEQGPGGKYLDTWRKNHLRPKPKKDEELNLPEAYERKYKAAPIVQDRDLETWFTQPPQS